MNLGSLYARTVHPEIAGLARYACELAGDDALPRRDRFDPERVAAIRDYLFLIEVLPRDNDYLFSLFGERMTMLYGTDLQGLRLSQVGDAFQRYSLRKTYDRVRQTFLPLFMRGHYAWPGTSIPIERLLIPMACDQGQVCAICGMSVPLIADTDLEIYRGEGPAQLVGDDELVLSVA